MVIELEPSVGVLNCSKLYATALPPPRPPPPYFFEKALLFLLFAVSVKMKTKNIKEELIEILTILGSTENI